MWWLLCSHVMLTRRAVMRPSPDRTRNSRSVIPTHIASCWWHHSYFLSYMCNGSWLVPFGSRGSAVSVATSYGLDGRGVGVPSPGKGQDYSFHSVQTGSGGHPASYQMGIGALSPGAKRPEREADHLPRTSAEVENTWIYTSTLPMRLHDVVLN
jgi:hypothetical protein